MRSTFRRFVVGVFVCSAIIGLAGCTETRRGPTSPSAAALPTRSLGWECGRLGASTSGDGWLFPPPEGCPPAVAVPDVGIGLIEIAPSNLRSTVTAATVRLDWDSVIGAVAFLIEAGSGPSLTDLARLNTGSAAPSLIVNNVPTGTYFVRVRAIGADGIPGPPSNEITVRVGVPGGCAAAPLAPTGFVVNVDGNRVALAWFVGASGDPATSFIVEAGSAPTLRNTVVFDTGTTATRLDAIAPTGVYYARIRGRNACGIGEASNEVVVAIGTPAPQLPPPGTPGTPPSPPPPPPQSPPPTSPPPPGGETGTSCTYTVTPSQVFLAATAGDFSVRVTTAAGCGWSASSSAGFVNGGTSSSGTGSASFAVSENPGPNTRQGSVTVSFATGGGQNVNVSQDAPVPASSSGPALETLLQLPQQQNPSVTNVTNVRNQQPPRANAGTGPVLGEPQVASGAAGTVQVQLNADRPFNTVIIASEGTSSHLIVELNPATTSASLSISVPLNQALVAQFAAAMDGELPGNYVDATLQSAPPPPSGPGIATLVRVRTQQNVLSQQLINAQPPSSGACAGCPILGAGTVTTGGVASSPVRLVASAIDDVSGTMTVQLATTNGVPFHSIILTAGTMVGNTPVASSYFLIRLVSPMTSVALALDVSATGPFTAHFAVTTDSNPPSNYVPVVLGITCTYTVTGPATALPSTAGTFDLTVTTTAGCSWTASSLSPSFIGVVNGSGTGSGTARFSVTTNLASTPRSGTVRVAGTNVTVTQVARGANP